MKSNLPAGWQLGTVADAYDAVKTTVDPTLSESVAYIGLEHLCKGGGIDSVGNSEGLQSIKTAFQTDDILYGKLRPYLNKHAVVDFDGVCSTDILVFRSKGEYPARLLDYYLGLPAVIQHANENSKGINLPRVNAGVMLDMPMPIPPLDEAKRIVAQLEATMQKLEASQERLEKLPELLKKFRQAVLAAAVSGKLTEAWRAKQPQDGGSLANGVAVSEEAGQQLSLYVEKKSTDHFTFKAAALSSEEQARYSSLPKGWEYVRLGDYAINLDNLRVPIASNLRASTQGQYPYYGASGIIDTIDDFTHDGEFVLIGEDGANLLTRSKPIAFLATGKIWVNNHAHVLKCIDGYPNDFLNFYINSIDLAPYVTGSAQPKLAQKNMNKIPVPVPPQAEQQEIVRQVNHYFELADQLEARFEQAAALVEQLPQALFAKAFSGQLVPQDPNDEPANALLERLGSEVGAPVKGKRGRKLKAMADAPLFE